MEPLLGPVDLRGAAIDWVIVGGESGPNHQMGRKTSEGQPEMTLDEMKSKSATLRERTDRADQLIAEIDQMRRISIPEARSIEYTSGIRTSVVTEDTLRDVLKRGVTAAIEAREIEIYDLLDVAIKCESCHGLGKPPGEAAGLVCDSCMGTGVER